MFYHNENLEKIVMLSGLAQQDFAEKMGVSVVTQRNYEKGLRKPTFDYLQKLHAAGYDVYYLLTGEMRGEILDPDTAALVQAYHQADAATAAAARRVLGIE